MGLFDRNPDKSGRPRSEDSATPTGGVDHSDDDLFDAIDSVDGIDVPEATRPLSVPGANNRPPEQTPDGPVPDGVREQAAPETPETPEPTEPTESTAVTDATERMDSANPSDAGEAKPKRDIYAMSGRARPQRIEPRSAEPAGTPEPSDGDRTEVFGAAAADPAYGVPDDEEQHQTRAFGSSVGASGVTEPAYTDGSSTFDGDPGAGHYAPETSVFAAGATGAGAAATTQVSARPTTDDRTVVSPDDPESADATAGSATRGGNVEADPRRGTLDFGLFILRVVVGALLVVRGLQTLFAFGGDPGISAFEQTLAAYNFADILAVGIPVAQIVAGGLLVFGLLTPVGSALTVVVAGFLALHNLSIWDSGYWPYTLSPQVQFWALLGLAGLVLTFTGPGRYAADASRGWATRPLASAWVFAVIGLAGAAGAWLAVGGGNPF